MGRADDKTLRTWPINVDMSDVERVAEYLYKMSRKFPGRPVPLTYIVRVANAMKGVPRENNQAVEAFRSANRMGRVRAILIEEHKCELDYVRGVGYCATSDSNHILDTVAEKRARGVRTAIDRMEKTMGLVKASEVTGKERKDRHRVLSGVADQLVAPKIKDKLLLLADNKDK